MKAVKHLIEQCIKQDRAAQKQLYLRHADHIMHTARRYAQDEAEAKDILQNTFVRIFYALEQFDQDKGNFKAWISRICINEAIAIKRKKKPIYFPEDTSDLLDTPIENEAIGSLTGEEIKRVVRLLEPGYQLIMQLYFYDELKTNEIAELLNLKESSVRSKISRARQKFINHWKMSNSL